MSLKVVTLFYVITFLVENVMVIMVIWWLVHEKIGDLMILKSYGDGDLAIFLLVIWWLVPEKIDDLVILSSYGDGDFPILRLCLTVAGNST